MGFSFLKISKIPDEKTVHLLSNNVIGTPNQSMLYQHLGVQDKIFQIADPHFVSLERNGQLMGTCCFCRRSTLNSGASMNAFYVRYFSFAELFRSKAGRKRKSTTSVLRKEVVELLNGGGIAGKNEKFYHYAYVDPRNARSRQLCEEFGFERVRQYTTVLFSRISPRVDQEFIVEVLKESDVASVQENLSVFYRNYSMLSFENLFGKRQYYVIKDKQGRVLVGAQAVSDRWKILSLPGFAGKIMLPLFSSMPLLNRLLNRRYNFLSVEGIFFEKGNEQLLPILFESLLAKFNRFTAIMVVDPGSPLYATLKSLDLGTVSKLNKEVRGDIICRFTNLSEEEKNSLRKNAAYISVIDVT